MLIRDSETGKIGKTKDASWPICSCGRCVLEDMEFPIYYGTDENDPHILDFIRKRGIDFGDPAQIGICLSLGIGTDECFECGDVFVYKDKRWVKRYDRDIRFEITHYFPGGFGPDISFETREIGTEGPYFFEFCTWNDNDRGHIENLEKTGFIVRLESPIPVERGAKMWGSFDGKIWLKRSPGADPEEVQVPLGDDEDEAV